MFNVLLCFYSIAAFFGITRISCKLLQKYARTRRKAYRSGDRSEKVSEDTPQAYRSADLTGLRKGVSLFCP